MWTAPSSKPRATPEQFNDHYLNCKSRGDHYSDVLRLTGNTTGKTVLDLGGGTLLTEHGYWYDNQYTLVDFSIEACTQAQIFARRMMPMGGAIQTYCCDVLQWIRLNKNRYDFTLCFGLLEYLPPNGLADILAYCTSDMFCLGVSAAEAYLQYPGRITIYSAEEIDQITSDYGWQCRTRLPMASHVWARYERIK